ncbi:MAG TPA: alpha-ketoacid dehydrogenase subunit beta [Firmicutes bacterium]|nr:alpha-ketoacid dehydrogenase subunit beta [Bacillota bacterium]
MAVRNIVETVAHTLREEMRRDSRIIVIGEDVAKIGGVFQATKGLLSEFGPERVIDAPLAESSLVGIAVGAAAAGLRPVVEIQFADFIYPAMDQIINEAARLRYRSNNGYHCPLVIRTPYGVAPGGGGGLYHNQSVEGMFCGVPGLKIVAPATPYDTKGLLIAALRDPDPVLFLEHKATYRAVSGEVPDEEYTIAIGKADVKREGRDLTVIAYGLMLHQALAAAEKLAKSHIDVEVVDLRSLKPLDKELICRSVRKTGKALVAHEDCLSGGIGGEIAAVIMEECFFHLDAPVMRVAAPDIPLAPYSRHLEEHVVPGRAALEKAMRELARF